MFGNEFDKILFVTNWVLEICYERNPVTHFMNDFSIIIQIRWKIGFSATPLHCIISLQNFGHLLLCHVQNRIGITVPQLEWEQNEISIEFALCWNFIRAIGPSTFIIHISLSSCFTSWDSPYHMVMSDAIQLSLTHWGRYKMTAILQTTFSWMKCFVFQLKFHSSLFAVTQLWISQHWFR